MIKYLDSALIIREMRHQASKLDWDGCDDREDLPGNIIAIVVVIVLAGFMVWVAR